MFRSNSWEGRRGIDECGWGGMVWVSGRYWLKRRWRRGERIDTQPIRPSPTPHSFLAALSDVRIIFFRLLRHRPLSAQHWYGSFQLNNHASSSPSSHLRRTRPVRHRRRHRSSMPLSLLIQHNDKVASNDWSLRGIGLNDRAQVELAVCPTCQDLPFFTRLKLLMFETYLLPSPLRSDRPSRL